MNIAEGSLAKTEYLLMVSKDLGYQNGDDARTCIEEAAEIARMLHALRSRVENSR